MVRWDAVADAAYYCIGLGEYGNAGGKRAGIAGAGGHAGSHRYPGTDANADGPGL